MAAHLGVTQPPVRRSDARAHLDQGGDAVEVHMDGSPAGLLQAALVSKQQRRLAVATWPRQPHVGTVGRGEMKAVQLVAPVDQRVSRDRRLEREGAGHGSESKPSVWRIQYT